MKVSQATFAEIRSKLLAAGYEHALSRDGGDVLDLHGITLGLSHERPEPYSPVIEFADTIELRNGGQTLTTSEEWQEGWEERQAIEGQCRSFFWTGMTKPAAPPRDLIAELCDLVREAGGTVRLCGQEERPLVDVTVTADDLRRVATFTLSDLRTVVRHRAIAKLREALASPADDPGPGHGHGR
jgi:hypothetical protein